MSENLEALRASLGAPLAEREMSETYGLADIRALEPEELEIFIGELAARVPGGDTRAMMTLGEIGGPVAVAALLSAALAPGYPGNIARRALANAGALGEDSPVLPLLLEDIRSDGMMTSFGGAMTVARAGLKHPAVLDALLKACDGNDAALRLKAYEVLLDALGLKRFTTRADGTGLELRSPLMVLDTGIRSRFKSLRAPALADVKLLVQTILDGTPPEALSLTYVPGPDTGLAALGRTLFDNPQPVPVDAVLAASGHDRRFAEMLLAKALERHLPKVATALADIGAHWAVPALREAMAEPDAPADFVDSATIAVERLSA